MKKWIERMEKYLIRTAALSLLLLVVVQGLMTSDPVRFYLSWGERMEGQSIEFPVSSSQSSSDGSDHSKAGFINISTGKYSSLPMTAIRVNGEIITYLDQHETRIPVSAGDIIELDSSYYQNSVEYHITAVSHNIAFPKKGQIVSVKQSVAMIGEIIVK